MVTESRSTPPNEPAAYLVRTSWDSWLFHGSEKVKADAKVKQLQENWYGTIFCTPLFVQSESEPIAAAAYVLAIQQSVGSILSQYAANKILDRAKEIANGH